MLKVKRVESRDELVGAQKVRHEVFCRDMGVFGGIRPDGLESDEYDEYSDHFIALRDGLVIGTLRLIRYQPGKAFPGESLSPLPARFDRRKSVEISRGSLLKEHRGLLGVTLKVIDCAYEFCKQEEIRHIFALANDHMYALYKKMRMPFEFVGEPVTYQGYVSFPLVMAVKPDRRILQLP
jgi:N-acyl-L-homoserine lactone synthetase